MEEIQTKNKLLFQFTINDYIFKFKYRLVIKIKKTIIGGIVNIITINDHI